MGKAFNTIHAIAQFGTIPASSIKSASEPAPVTPERCDWCGYKSEHLSHKPTIDGSSGQGRGYHVLCRRCVARYSQEAKEYRASHAK